MMRNSTKSFKVSECLKINDIHVVQFNDLKIKCKIAFDVTVVLQLRQPGGDRHPSLLTSDISSYTCHVELSSAGFKQINNDGDRYYCYNIVHSGF